MSEISIPYKFTPRPYQLELLKALDSGYNRALAVWHRRAGKDKTLFNYIIKEAVKRKGVYYYFFPEFAQGRRVIWDGMDSTGFRFLSHIPNDLVESMNSTDMKIELTTGSIIQVIGTDKFDKVRGANPVGCVFSEFAYQNPLAWDIVRPILLENKGWAVFNSTPCGKNHFHDLYQMAVHNKNWFTQLITVEESLNLAGTRYLNEEAIQAERDSGMSEEMIQQEYYCDFTANSQGFYYLKNMNDLEKNKAITSVPHDPSKAVSTWWDIGVGDSTAIWFTQIEGRQIRVIDFYMNNSVGIDHYAKYLKSLPYVYEAHNFPHDMRDTEFGTGRSRYEVAEELFKGTRLNIVQKVSLEDGINATRMILPQCVFDANKCEFGIKALFNYHREWDAERKEFKNKPVHDWSSHPADAFRYFAVGFSIPRQRAKDAGYYTNKSRTRSWMVA